MKDKIRKTLKNKLFLQTIKVLLFRVSGIVLLFGFTLYLTNFYPSNIVGQYDFVRSVIFLFGSICLLGTDQSILYFKGILDSQGRSSEIRSVYIKMIKIIFFISLSLFTLICLVKESIFIDFFRDVNIYRILLYSFSLLFFYSISTLNSEVMRTLDMISMSELFRNIVKYIPVFLGSLVLFYIDKKELLIYVFLFGFVLIAMVSSILIFWRFSKLKNREIKGSIISTRQVFNKSYPIAISSMAFFLLLSIDVMFLKKYRNNSIVAYYSVAVKFVLIISMIINAINVNASSKIAEFYKNNNFLELNKLLNNSARIIFLLSLPLILSIFLFSEKILSFFGENYIEAKYPLLIMVFSQGFCTLFGSVTVYLNMTGRQNIFKNILLGAVIINFLLNLILIPNYGMVGASIAFSCSLVFWNILSAIIIYRKDNIKIFAKF
ncbi:MATE family efflux transporter [Polaribacter cellanae]|uniref:Oligosaccharide flippase family protein n=1 Tax=Polaribacter cellanae TaxID=2818493 RepID=A0A975H5K1_9FLAO|nr:MATE family efflux transporter [Polaribacter cellanae]QTE21496.1 oligosaccharide flippase family protein [Polaribacter cellanae]